MKKEEIDKLITESLNKDEADFYNTLEEENVFERWGGVYSGKNGLIAIVMSVMSVFIVIFAIIAFYCGYWFFTVDTTHEMLRYGAGMFIFMMFTAFLKLRLWNQIDKNSILRELKRIEFQVAVLMEKISDIRK